MSLSFQSQASAPAPQMYPPPAAAHYGSGGGGYYMQPTPYAHYGAPVVSSPPAAKKDDTAERLASILSDEAYQALQNFRNANRSEISRAMDIIQILRSFSGSLSASGVVDTNKELVQKLGECEGLLIPVAYPNIAAKLQESTAAGLRKRKSKADKTEGKASKKAKEEPQVEATEIVEDAKEKKSGPKTLTVGATTTKGGAAKTTDYSIKLKHQRLENKAVTIAVLHSSTEKMPIKGFVVWSTKVTSVGQEQRLRPTGGVYTDLILIEGGGDGKTQTWEGLTSPLVGSDDKDGVMLYPIFETSEPALRKLLLHKHVPAAAAMKGEELLFTFSSKTWKNVGDYRKALNVVSSVMDESFVQMKKPDCQKAVDLFIQNYLYVLAERAV